MSAYQMLNSSESLLEGKWVASGGAVIADYASLRIEYLINNVLLRIANDDSGWMTLYRDQVDGRYWELSYPDSGSHGGGAPLLKCLTYEEAKKSYQII